MRSTDEGSIASRLLHATAKTSIFIALALSACSTTNRDTPPAPVVKAPATPAAVTRSETPVLPSVVKPTNWEQYRMYAAQRIVAANEGRTYMGTPPDQLLAIPVLEIELASDGSVRRIAVLRYPTQAKETTQLAIDAVKRAAPFGDVSKLPRPWKFVETFLFDDDKRFKPRSLD